MHTCGDVIFNCGHYIKKNPKPVCCICTFVLPCYKAVQLYKHENLSGTPVQRSAHKLTLGVYLYKISVPYATLRLLSYSKY